MAKYSFEFKIEVVQAYLNAEGGYRYLASKYNIPAKRRIEEWVHAYREFGEEGLMRSRQNKKYTFQFKLSMVELYLSSEVSYQLRIENAYLKELRRLRLEEETLLKKQRELSTVSEDSSN